MPPSEDKSHIDELKNSLYSRNAPDVRTKRKTHVSEDRTDIPSEWERTVLSPEITPTERFAAEEKHSMSFFTKLLVISAVFCLVAVGIGAYLFWNGANLISADNIDIKISGPVSIPGGEPITFDIEAKNNNNIALESVEMSVDFPVGTTDPANPSNTLKNHRKSIGEILAGASAKESVKVVMFGEENIQKQIMVTLTYNVKGSTAVFTKTKSYDVLINSSPIGMTATSFKEITSGQEFDIKVELRSNSESILRNIILKADYPTGYQYISSSLAPLSDKSTWKIGDLPVGSKKTITIHGTLAGEDNDLRVFHFSVGAQSPNDPKVIGTQYMAIEQDVTIQKPFISLDINIDNDESGKDYVTKFGESKRVSIKWFNNLPNTVSNMKITAKLSGSAYDKNTVSPNSGYFDSSSNSIVWSQQTNPELASVGAGEDGQVSFALIPRDIGSGGSSAINPMVTIVANVSGNRTQESNVPQAISAAVTRNLRVASNVALTGRVVRSAGPFVNSGPIPPKVDQATTYTVIWSVDNTTNAIGDAQVTATLPPYVKWLKAVNPATEDVTYDTNSGEVTWNIGNVNAYTLKSTQRREVAFQVSMTPNITQTGRSPFLVNQATLTATDNFTNAKLQSVQDSLTTRFSTDPAYKQGDEIVAR